MENIFDHICEQNNLSNRYYDIFGHSAGGQFVHRMILLIPDARIHTAIAANAGAYMFIDPKVKFPFGLKKVSIDKSDLEKSLKRKLVILLGETDTTLYQGRLDQRKPAKKQGFHRLERGTNFFRTSENFAKKNDLKFNWMIDTVKNVDHNFRRMSEIAVKYLTNQSGEK